MIGRARERGLIEDLLAGARSGRSGTLVLSGEPGVGKSALLAFAMDRAAGMRILRVAGVETEIELAFAGLHQLVRPVLHVVEHLPPPQAKALLGAFGLVEHRTEDRLLVALAVLSVLSEVADEGPVLCVVEDAHWLDQPSVEALAFSARRLDAEGVVVLAATREQGWPGLPVVRIDGFGSDDAAELLRQVAADVAADVCDRLVEETGGNALALVEAATSLSAEQLAGTEALPPPLPLTGRVQEAFLGRVRRLPSASQALLLVAAADDTGDPAVVFRAAGQLGVKPDALEAAERAGLARIDETGRFVFRHPLVRASIYRGATFTRRTAAHRALAAAVAGDDHAERRAWHLAAAATGPDESLARDLERSAEVARRRGGPAVAATTLEQAAELSAVRSERTRRLVAAAQDAYRAGQADRAQRLADRAARLIEEPTTRAQLTWLQARIAFGRGSSVTAHGLFLTAARGLAEHDARAAAAALMEAARAAWNVADAKRYLETMERLAAVRLPADDPLGPLVAISVGVGELVAGRMAEAVANLRGATATWLSASSDRPVGSDGGQLEASIAMAGATRVTGDDSAGLTLGSTVVAECRTRGLAALLPWALVNLSMTEALAGRHPAAVVTGSEALRLARDLDQPMAICSCASVLAWLAAVRGEQDRCRELAAEAVDLSDAYQLPAIAVFATWALALLDLSLGRPDQALDRMLDRTRGPLAIPGTRLLIVPDLIEAAVRAGRTDRVDNSLDWYECWAAGTGQPWAEAAAHRCRAMLADQDAEARYLQAMRLHELAGPEHRPFDRARTQLLYGEWLRRARRRADARIQLTAAHETFQRLDATPWTDRAATELRATGQTVGSRGPGTVRLTPQEMQVVRLVADGRSNQDVAAQLFLSPRTVAYHLYKAYPKLGIGSRADLARLDLDTLLATR